MARREEFDWGRTHQHYQINTTNFDTFGHADRPVEDLIRINENKKNMYGEDLYGSPISGDALSTIRFMNKAKKHYTVKKPHSYGS